MLAWHTFFIWNSFISTFGPASIMMRGQAFDHQGQNCRSGIWTYTSLLFEGRSFYASIPSNLSNFDQISIQTRKRIEFGSKLVKKGNLFQYRSILWFSEQLFTFFWPNLDWNSLKPLMIKAKIVELTLRLPPFLRAKFSASVPSNLFLVMSNVLRFFFEDLMQISWCFSILSSAKLRPQLAHWVKSSLGLGASRDLTGGAWKIEKIRSRNYPNID